MAFAWGCLVDVICWLWLYGLLIKCGSWYLFRVMFCCLCCEAIVVPG